LRPPASTSLQLYEAWIAADPTQGGVRVLITGPQGFERTVAFALDDYAARQGDD
jgi:hypothetical protein